MGLGVRGPSGWGLATRDLVGAGDEGLAAFFRDLLSAGDEGPGAFFTGDVSNRTRDLLSTGDLGLSAGDAGLAGDVLNRTRAPFARHLFSPGDLPRSGRFGAIYLPNKIIWPD